MLVESVLCGLQFLLGECCNLRYGGGHLALLCGLCRRGCARIGVADLRSELGAVHLLEDDLRVLADLSAELLERGFEFDFRHDVICDLQIYDFCMVFIVHAYTWRGKFRFDNLAICDLTNNKSTAFFRKTVQRYCFLGQAVGCGENQNALMGVKYEF